MTTLAVVEAEQVEMALDAAGLAWSRRGENWAVPAAGEVAREILVMLSQDGLRVDAVLIEWEEAAAECLEALAFFLKRSERDIQLVRGEIVGTQARLVAAVSAEQIEGKLGETLHVISLGCRLLAREARALLSPDLARHYLTFQQGEPGA